MKTNSETSQALSLCDDLGGAIVLAERVDALRSVAAYVLQSKQVLKSLDRLMTVEPGAFDTMELMCPTWNGPDAEGTVLEHLGLLLAASAHDMEVVQGALKHAHDYAEQRAGTAVKEATHDRSELRSTDMAS